MSNEEMVEQIQKGIDVAANQERLCRQNRLFIKREVKRICRFTEDYSDFEDFEQEAFIGLLAAATGYDSGKGVKFLTYAGWHIRRAVFRYMENHDTNVKIPAYLKERIRKYAGFCQRMWKETGRYPTREEALAELQLSEKSLGLLEKSLCKMRTSSLDKEYPEDGRGGSLLDTLQAEEDTEGQVVFCSYHRDLQEALALALSILDKDTRIAICSTYLQGKPVGWVAGIFDCSQQAVYERIQRGFWKILHSRYRKVLEGFMWEGYRYNEYAYSEFAEMPREDEANEFLV